MPSHKSNDYKLTAVQYYLVEDKTQEEVCKIFKCSPRSLMRWVDRYEEENSIKRHNRKPIAYKVSKNNVKFILEEINKNKTITIDEILSKLKKKFPDLDLSKMHIHRIIKDNNITDTEIIDSLKIVENKLVVYDKIKSVITDVKILEKNNENQYVLIKAKSKV